MSAVVSLIGWGLLNLLLVYVMPLLGDNVALRILTLSSTLFLPTFLGTYVVKRFNTPEEGNTLPLITTTTG
jgi:hypothetical protein